MAYPNLVINENDAIDFYVGSDTAYRILLPIWEALGERRGTIYASRHVRRDDVDRTSLRRLDGYSPIVVTNYKDLSDVYMAFSERPIIYYEPTSNTVGKGLLKYVSLFLCEERSTCTERLKITKEVYWTPTPIDAAQSILDYMKGRPVNYIERIDKMTVGLIYLCWGKKAWTEIMKSLASLRRLGYAYPTTIIGDFDDKLINIPRHVTLVQSNVNPFDTSKERNFQFRAGRVKPTIISHTLYDLNLYIDADTRFMQPIHQAFTMLKSYDIMVTEERLTLQDLYNKKLAGWELNISERDLTMKEINDHEGVQKFINSGVIFFQRNHRTLKLFDDWLREWERFQEWDEQLALMRAIYKQKDLKVKRLSVNWNYPHSNNPDTIIFHNYGRGTVRMSHE